MNPNLDDYSCSLCKYCYRNQNLQCVDACRRCGIAMFSSDTVNVYPSASSYPYTPNYPFAYPQYSPNRKSEGILYYNYPKVSNYQYPSMYPYANYYGSLYRPSLSFF